MYCHGNSQGYSRHSKDTCHIGSFNQPNISYKVRYKDSLDAMRHGGAIGDRLALIKGKHSKSSEACLDIVYVNKRDDTAFIAKQITSTTGIPAAAYADSRAWNEVQFSKIGRQAKLSCGGGRCFWNGY
jgi:superfamily II DNA helicase RecQ